VIQGTFRVILGTFGVIQGTFRLMQGTFGVIQGTFHLIHVSVINYELWKSEAVIMPISHATKTFK
jgi:hypothetical protein